MKKTVFIIVSSQYYFKYITNKSFKLLEKKYKVYYLFNKKKIIGKNLKIRNKIFYSLNENLSIWITYFLHFLRFSNHKKCKTFKATTEWYFPNYDGLKQIFKQENRVELLLLSYFKSSLKKLILSILSIRVLSNLVTSVFYKKIQVGGNLNKIFLKLKPDLIIYPTHGMEPELLIIQKLSEFHKSKTFHIIDNWDNLTTSTYYEFKPDYIGVWGKQTKIHAMRFHNFKKEKIFLLGNCRLDKYFELNKKKLRRSKRNYILFISCKIRVDEFYYLEILNDILKNNKKIFKNTKILYRPHPQDRNLEIIKKLNRLENVRIDKTVFADKKIPYFKNDINLLKKNYLPLLFNAKFIVGCISSVIIEGLILNKSYLVIAFKKKIDDFYNPKWWSKNFVHWDGFEKVNNVKLSYNKSQYEKMFIELFKNQNKNNDYLKTKNQLKYFYHKNKLSYDKNIKKIIKKIL